MKITRKHTLVAATLVTLMAVAAMAAASAASQPGCEPVTSPVTESQQFTPAELQRSRMFDPRLPAGQPGAESAVVAMAGKSSTLLPTHQFDLINESGEVYSYYLDQPIEGLRVSEFIKAGGVQVHREPMTEPTSFASFLIETLGDRATPVEVGPHQGALIWADPDVSGTRTHNLYWSDGKDNYALIVDLSANETLNLGRALVCG